MSVCCTRGHLWSRRFEFKYAFLLIWTGCLTAPPAHGQSALDYCNNSSNPWQCTSTTTNETVNQTVLPAIITVPSVFSSLSGQLALAFASPAGPTLQQLLAPYLGGAPVPQKISTQTQSSSTVEPGVTYFDGEEALIGPDQIYRYYVPPGLSIVVTNTRTDEVTDEVYQLQQTLDAAATNWLLGDIYAAVPTILIDGDFAFIATLFDHARGGMADNRAPAGGPLALMMPKLVPPAVDAAALVAAGPGGLVAPAWTAWLDGGFAQSTLSSTSEHFGMSFTTAESAVGTDYKDGPWRAGGSLGLARTGFQQSATGDSGSVTSLRIGAYAGFDAGNWSLMGGLSGGYHWTQATRLSGMPAPASASFGSTSLSAGLEAVYRMNLWEAGFEPFAGSVLSMASAGGFTEAGSTGLEIVGQPTTTRAMTVYAGARVSSRHEFGNLVLTPESHVRLLYEVLGEERTVATSFAAGTPVQVAGLQPGRLAAQIGAGLGVEFSRHWSAAFAGELQFRSGGDFGYRLLASASGNW